MLTDEQVREICIRGSHSQEGIGRLLIDDLIGIGFSGAEGKTKVLIGGVSVLVRYVGLTDKRTLIALENEKGIISDHYLVGPGNQIKHGRTDYF